MNQHDIDILRGLGEHKARLAGNPQNLERKKLWYKHDEGEPVRPMVLIFPEGVVDPNAPMSASALKCKDEFLRSVEAELRGEICHFEKLKDDCVIEPYINLKWNISSSDYGVNVVYHSAAEEGSMGAKNWDAPLKDLDRDLGLLKPRRFSVDRESTLKQKEILEMVFKDILPVRIYGRYGNGARLTDKAIHLVGLENLMLLMCDNPAGLHRLMAFLRDDHLNYVRWLEDESLYSLNNGNDVFGSGSIGYTRSLPQPDWKPGDKVRMKDQWWFADSQETVGVSAGMYAEFVLPYISAIGKYFGRIYYGCCEPLHDRIKLILDEIPNIKRVSVSPWANEEIMARELRKDVVYCRKPNPALISAGSFNEELIRKDLRKTLSVAGDRPLEFVMKDLHTLGNRPERAARWVEIAFEEINRIF